MANKSYKGRVFEIQLAARLSLWWTDGERDDVLYHTHDSGGRATRRSRKGWVTAGSCGDICATDFTAQPLMDVVAIEAKRGYNQHTIAHLLDSPGKTVQEYEKWIEQAALAALNARSFSWLLIVRRDYRIPIVIFPQALLRELQIYGALVPLPKPSMTMTISTCDTLVVTTLDAFLDGVKPDTIRRLSRKLTRSTDAGSQNPSRDEGGVRG